jgi:heterotetrameric sarcosine oxidase gamma subunit
MKTKAAAEQSAAAISGGVEVRASVTDQSHGRVFFRIAGPCVRDVLAKGTPVDLHPRIFGKLLEVVDCVSS